MAAPLEAEWNARLEALQAATREHERLQRRDSAALWDAPSTSHADRKRLLALLVKDVTLDRDGYRATVGVRFRGGRGETVTFRGGRGETVTAALPRPVWQVRKADRATLAALDRLLDTCTDAEAAAELNRRGLANWNGAPFHARRVRALRRHHGLRSLAQRLADRGFLTARAMARQLGACVTTVRQRAHKGLLRRVRYSDGNRPKHLYAPLDDGQPTVTETRRNAEEPERPDNEDSKG